MAKNTKPQTKAAQVTADAVDPATTAAPEKGQKVNDTETQAPKTMPGEAGLDHHVSGADPSTVEKKTVKTSGSFSLQDPWTGALIDAQSTGTEVIVTSFIRERLENGDLIEA